MAPIHTLLFLALSLSINGLMFSDHLLITFSNQNPNNSLALVAVRAFAFFLVPFTFTSAIVLLLLHVSMPKLAYIKHLTMATQVLVSAILLFATALMVHVVFTEAVVLDALKFMLIGAAAAAMYKYDPFKRCINSAGQTTGNFVPVFMALCISTGTLLFIVSFSGQNHESTLVPIPIRLLFLSLNCLNFFLAMVLLFLWVSAPADGPKTAIPAILMENLVKGMLAICFTAILIGLCMIVEYLVGII